MKVRGRPNFSMSMMNFAKNDIMIGGSIMAATTVGTGMAMSAAEQQRSGEITLRFAGNLQA